MHDITSNALDSAHNGLALLHSNMQAAAAKIMLIMTVMRSMS